MKFIEKQQHSKMMVAIPSDIHHEYKVYCANRRLKLNEVINHVLSEWIKEWRLK